MEIKIEGFNGVLLDKTETKVYSRYKQRFYPKAKCITFRPPPTHQCKMNLARPHKRRCKTSPHWFQAVTCRRDHLSEGTCQRHGPWGLKFWIQLQTWDVQIKRQNFALCGLQTKSINSFKLISNFVIVICPTLVIKDWAGLVIEPLSLVHVAIGVNESASAFVKHRFDMPLNMWCTVFGAWNNLAKN